MKKDTHISFIDACCGSGKTEDALTHILENQNDRFIILQPTIELIQKTIERLKSIGYTGQIKAIFSEENAKYVTSRIHDHLNNPESSGVMFATFEGWAKIVRRKKLDWHLIIDECPAVYGVTDVLTKAVSSRLMDHLEVKPLSVDGYSVVAIKKGSRKPLLELLELCRTDKAVATLQASTQMILSRRKTYVSQKMWDAFVQPEGKSVRFHHIVSSSFVRATKTVTIMSANFKDTSLYHIWAYHGLQFTQKEGFSRQLPTIHPEEIGNKLDIYYLCDDWSAELKKKNLKIYTGELKRAVKELFGQERFIYTRNTSDDPLIFEGVGNGVYVKPKAHGINDYREFNNAVLFSHFNMSADRVSFLFHNFSIPKELGWELLNKDFYYQFACRISLREMPPATSNIEPKKLVLMDKAMALYIQSRFPGSRVHKVLSTKIDAIPIVKVGRKPEGNTAASGYDRVIKSRLNYKVLDGNRKLEILKGSLKEKLDGSTNRIRNENTLKNKDEDMKEKKWSISFIGNLYSKEVLSYLIDGMVDLACLLHQMSGQFLEQKSDNRLFCVTQFIDENGKPRGRKLIDVSCSYAILQDMDSELNCCPYAYANLFAGTEMLIYSSFSSTPERKRWRVVIPMSRPISQPEYNRIAKDLKAIALQQGFPLDKKQQPNDFMYLPCHGLSEEAFMLEFFDGGKRRPLDVDKFLSAT